MSWLLTSASGPLLLLMSYIHGLGMLGPRVLERTITTSPIAPSSTSFFACMKEASNLRMNASCSLTPFSFAARSISLHSSTVIAIGFSHRMCLPALAAATAISQ